MIKRAELRKKQEKLGRVWEEYKDFRNGLDKDETKWSTENREKFDKFDTDIDGLDQDIAVLKRQIKDEERETRYSNSEPPGNQGGGDDPPAGANEPGTGGENRSSTGNRPPDRASRDREEAFRRFLLDGMGGMTREQRDMLAGEDVSGGYLVTPEQFVSGLLKSVDDQVQIRGMATVHTLKQAASLGVVKLDDDLDDWTWTTELGTGEEDDGLGFGKRELRTYPMAKRIKVSETLLRKSNIGVEALIRQRMAYKLGGTMESNYMTGDGHNKPLGLFTASSDGISSARDMATDNTATSLKPDNLISVQGALKAAYQAKARWLFHQDAITKIRKLKDGEGQYLWQPGLSAGAQNQILGKPYVLSEWCPNTFTTGEYAGMYGDFSYYWIVDCLSMTVKVLKELYAETDQVGYIGRYEGDGQPVLEEAFVRIKMG